MNERVILGVDAGITTGLALLSVHEDGWTLRKRWDFRPELESRGDQLLALWDELDRHGCEEMAMEEMLAYGTNTSQEKIEAQAAVKMYCAKGHLPLYTYAPVTIRSRVMGHGKATDAQIKATLRFFLDMGRTNKRGEAFSPHQQDAVAVALCHAIKGHGLILDRQGVLR